MEYSIGYCNRIWNHDGKRVGGKRYLFFLCESTEPIRNLGQRVVSNSIGSFDILANLYWNKFD